MRSVFQICLVTVVLLIACVIADWELSETVFMASFVFIWQVLFILIMMKIHSRRYSATVAQHSSFFWYLVFPVAAVISPTLAILFILIGTILDLKKVSGGVSIKSWIKEQKVHDQRSTVDSFLEVKFPDEGYNPATGYPLHGGIDSAGNPNGSNWYQR